MTPSEQFLYTKGETNEWYTPKHIIDCLGPFDLDPCSPVVRPFNTARIHLTKEDNGLIKGWGGRVWLNPPYSELTDWIKRLSQHGNGIALLPTRSESIWFHRYVFDKASAVLFQLGRIKFLPANPDSPLNGAPFAPVFVAYGANNTQALKQSGIKGKLIVLR